MRTGAPVPDGLVILDGALARGAFEIDADSVWSALDAGTVIVRSSAVGEDSADASFAGQLDSIADVTGPDALREAIARVWDSRRSDRVLAYQAARGITLAGMGIIVQRQVQAALSGVLFTVSPSDPGEMLLEYCAGMGDALVSGAINPGRVSIRRSAQWRQIAAPDDPTPAAERLLLNDVQIAHLTRLALDIERTFGAPQDIEWTIDHDGRLWIVQSRPITTSSSATTSTAQVHWSNANISENFPQPVSPLLYSVARLGYYHYFRNLGRAFGLSRQRLALMEPALRQIIGVHGARMYYNLTSIHSILRSAPFGEQLARSFNTFVGAEDTSAVPVGPAYRLRQTAELMRIAAQTTWQYVFVISRVERFEATVDAYAASTHPKRLGDKSLQDLVADFRGFLDIRCNHWKDAALADTGAMVCYGLLQRLLARAFDGRDQQALHHALLKALPDLVSGIPALKLWDLSRQVRADRDLSALFDRASATDILHEIRVNPQFWSFRDGLDGFLEQLGFRCSAELMLTIPSFQEDPAPLIDLLKAYVARDGESPAEILARQEAERLRDTQAALAELRRRPITPWLPFVRQSAVLRTLLRWTQRTIQLRERARLKQALLYSRLRRVALAIGDRLTTAGRLERPEDIFFLTAEEVDLLASGGAMFPDHVMPLIALRREAHVALSATTPPDAIALDVGAYLPAHGTDLRATTPHADAGGPLRGVGACGGSATARAAILLDVTESTRLSAGDVLVTKQTDPGWGPIFPLIAGLVIERGGMLSHGAIIAREFGIPSVVGVKDATRLIAHGASITVDGNRGLVHLIDEKSTAKGKVA
jgi:phosphohistidine swiveling domain-containing protein